MESAQSIERKFLGRDNRNLTDKFAKLHERDGNLTPLALTKFQKSARVNLFIVPDDPPAKRAKKTQEAASSA